MKTSRRAFAVLALAGLLPSVVGADEPPADATVGSAADANAAEIIAERQALMTELENLMRPLDSFTAGEAHDRAELRSASVTMSEKLRTLPRLFPPATNLYDPAAATPVTLALPSIWQDFATFSALAEGASTAATNVSTAGDPAELRAAGLALRTACDACHALYLRPYEPATVSSEDLEFDFDALFEGDEAPAEPAEAERPPRGAGRRRVGGRCSCLLPATRRARSILLVLSVAPRHGEPFSGVRTPGWPFRSEKPTRRSTPSTTSRSSRRCLRRPMPVAPTAA